ncbi:ketimine reductase mu-crystallin isoform X2 [Anabrus simplex]|uniref:ketimine reductase mu-crystallin isoform X2 n=1 Tax=Anabrus simplex TaxID=316456 RepID=UPI0035A2ED58
MEETSPPLYLNNETVKQLLDWDKLVCVIERVMKAVSNPDDSNMVVQPPRTIMPVPEKDGVLLSMPGYSKADDALACKLVTAFPRNKQKGIPSIIATVLLFDAETGKVSVVMEGTELTAWRTAAASVVATKYMHNGTDVLAVLGSGAQARSHIQALDHFFHFKEIRVWNHRFEGAEKLAKEYKKYGKPVTAYENAEKCVRNADVIVTATFADSPILKGQWIKPGVHINAVGAGVNHHSELDTDLYKAASIFTDSMSAAKVELHGLANIEVTIQGEIGDIIQGKYPAPRGKITVFHSLALTQQQH